VKAFDFFQKLSRSFIMPIALLSFASLLMGVSSLFLWHDQLRELMPFIGNPAIQYGANLMNTVADVIMGNLPLLFAVSIAYTVANEFKEFAAFGALVGYLAFLMGMGFLIGSSETILAMFPSRIIKPVLGITTIDTGVVGGIIVGILSGLLHNLAYKVKLPMAIAFFGGTRFVPIANAMAFVVFGQLFPFVWTGISNAINVAALAVSGSGIFGPFLYGFGERLLIPTGLHQIWNTVIRDTAVSGIYEFPSGLIEGARAAFNEYLKTNIVPEGTTLVDMVKYLRGGQMPITMFGLPAAALAMYHCAKPENRVKVYPLIVTGIFTSFIAGITEPLEFAFLFASPLLYFVYAVFNGLSFMLVNLLGSQMGGVEANVVGMLLYGLLRAESRWYIALLVGLVQAGALYFLFRWFIVKFNVQTPGRGGDYDQGFDFLGLNEEAASQDKGASVETDPRVIKAKVIIEGLGGKANILEVDSCMSRLRVRLQDGTKVNEALLKTTGCSGIIKPSEHTIQVVYGTTVSIIHESVKKQLS
jgi:maltose/glucose PTS system EIICB component